MKNKGWDPNPKYQPKIRLDGKYRFRLDLFQISRLHVAYKINERVEVWEAEKNMMKVSNLWAGFSYTYPPCWSYCCTGSGISNLITMEMEREFKFNSSQNERAIGLDS